MEGGVSGRSSYGGDDDEEKPRALHHHHRSRLEGPSGGDIIAVKVEKGSHDDQQSKETLKMEVSSSGDLDSSSTSLNQNHQQNDRLESARAEMGEVKEENERLKMYLDRIMREYKALQMHFLETLKQGDQYHENKDKTPLVAFKDHDHDHHTSLSLGPTTVSGFSPEKNKNTVSMNWASNFGVDKQNLALSLNCNKGVSKSANASSNSPVNISPENSFENQKEETDEFRPPRDGKVQKRSGGGDDEASQQNAAKKTRVSVRARCDTPTMHDGCQWRKYGQKISKGNPCPRAYYRCTIAPSCPVRKQVQRCPEDMSILTTTYEGSHNHPLPVSATAMASTTSAAASMLLSGSSSSSPATNPGLTPNATTDLHGLNFYLSDPSRSKQFYLPNTTSMSSSAPTHPTITLDLTNSYPNYSGTPSHFGRFGSSVYSPVLTRSYNMSTSVSFGSPEHELPISWGNGGNYGQLYPRSQPQDTFLQLQSNNHSQQDSIAAATKAITTDPNFQSTLATVLKSIIGGSISRSSMGSLHGGGGDGLGQRLTNSQQMRNLVFKQPSFPLSNSMNTSSPK